MSIVAAVCKGKQIAIASDTVSCWGSHRDRTDNVVHAKIRRIGRSLVGGTGWALYDNILDHYLARRRAPSLKDERAIFQFFLTFWKTMRQRYPFVNDQPHKEDGSPFADLDSTFLVVNRNGIFAVDADMSVLRFKKYHAIGTGSKYAYGAMHALYDHQRSARHIADSAVQASINFDESCGGKIESYVVK